ncbi:hypothetical protein QQX10_02250 [Demequina sp. SYSU T00039]|uniref:Uncharacterized protein n=1 Tax=Demequina lignilytica TaxID=3051663 RepID=A0AAW7M863_9MICO|nr:MULTISPECIES: hypothetical protein [unclassified Demequina]MDN4478511.1 hypothetical protein [Demequina sp. SYSU T00039-1]MDN4486982.1 hypothetical protein [Demequina sp. SYSU T00039]
MDTLAHGSRTVRRVSPDDLRSLALPVGMLSYLLATLVLVPLGALLYAALSGDSMADTSALILAMVDGLVALVALVSVVPLAAVVFGQRYADRAAGLEPSRHVLLQSAAASALATPFAITMVVMSLLGDGEIVATLLSVLVGVIGPAALGAAMAAAVARRIATRRGS